LYIDALLWLFETVVSGLGSAAESLPWLIDNINNWFKE
jgi:hypothetical protein